jgi:hypothetical protein
MEKIALTLMVTYSMFVFKKLAWYILYSRRVGAGAASKFLPGAASFGCSSATMINYLIFVFF